MPSISTTAGTTVVRLTAPPRYLALSLRHRHIGNELERAACRAVEHHAHVGAIRADGKNVSAFDASAVARPPTVASADVSALRTPVRATSGQVDDTVVDELLERA
jgi:hypothetical protein